MNKKWELCHHPHHITKKLFNKYKTSDIDDDMEYGYEISVVRFDFGMKDSYGWDDGINKITLFDNENSPELDEFESFEEFDTFIKNQIRMAQLVVDTWNKEGVYCGS